MKQKWTIFLICLGILGFINDHTVFAQQKKASVDLKLFVSPVLYSEIKEEKLVIESNSSETISVYSDLGLIYESSDSSTSFSLPQDKNSQYSIISTP